MKKKIFISIIVLVIIIFNCRNVSLNVPKDNIDKFGIVFIVNTVSQTQVGVISKTQDPNLYNYYNFSDTAQVYINGFQFNSIPDDSLYTWLQEENVPYTYNYINRNLKLNPGEICSLQVTLPNGEVINGTTKIPHDIQLSGIVNDEDNYYVKWQGPKKYVYEWELYEKVQENDNYVWRGRMGQFTGYTQYATIDKKEISLNSEYKIVVFINDENFADYVMQKKDPAGLDKQYGLFGSVHLNTFYISF